VGWQVALVGRSAGLQHTARCRRADWGSGLVAAGGPCRREEGRARVARQAQTVGELRGKLARGPAHARLNLPDGIDRAIGLLRQRLLGQILRFAQPVQEAAE
jgi:hypothetical protein